MFQSAFTVRGDTSKKQIALIFTGGDYGEGTSHILDVLQRRKVKASFFVTGDYTRKPDLQGRVMVQFTIAPTGQVAASIVQSSTMGNPPVEQCIANAVRRWEFPKPQGGIVVVTYPFVLKSAGE